MNRTCIIISPYFPPSTLAGVHRARHLAKHLPAWGWTPIIVAVDEVFHEEQLDFGLASLVPNTVEIIKTSAIPPQFCRPLGVGEISLRAWFPLRSAVDRLLSTRKIDLVLITGSPYYPMLMARRLRRQFRVPVVLDFQDPWVSNRGARLPRCSKAWLSHQLALLLEPKVLREADFITSVSETQNAELLLRYPRLSRSKMLAIPIGGDSDDYKSLPWQNLSLECNVREQDGFFSIVYAGTIWPPVLDTLRTVFKAAKTLQEAAPKVYASLRFNFIGTTANPNDTTNYRVLPLAKEEGVADIVRETPQRLPYLEALSVQARGNAVLMLGSDEPHYTASKIFGVLMSRRPYLSIFHAQSSAHKILKGAGGGISLAFRSGAELPALVDSIACSLIKLVTEPDSILPAQPASYAAYTADAVAGQFAAVFDRLKRA